MSNHTFAKVPSVDIPRSSFRRDMTYKTTFNAGVLTPIFCEEVIPGDTWNLHLSSFARILSPLKYPIMDNLYMDFQFFFVPVRLVYDDYEKFFGSSKGQSGNWEYDDSHVMPGITAPTGGFTVGSIADYFGIPVGVAGIKVNALPFRAYNKIINDWYLPSVYEMTGPLIKTDSTDDSISDYSLVKRIKRCDYFTSALIAPQRGPGATIGLAGTAPVVGNGLALALSDGTHNFELAGRTGGSTSTGVPLYGATVPSQGSIGDSVPIDGQVTDNNKAIGVSTNKSYSALEADLSDASAITINALRQAFQLQRALERDMRGGVQYVSQLMAHFGVRSPDARLQRSEYLGGGSTPVNIHTVAQTSKSTTSAGGKVADLAAYATSGQSQVGFVKSFTEHGYIIGLVSVRADLTYQQGIPRMFDRWKRFDFYYPVFSHLGEQTILNKEIFAQGPSVVDSNGDIVDEKPFGYQERYGEYRYGVSKITGLLRSGVPNSLDVWHLAQQFNNLPTLSQQFLEENVPMSRVESMTSSNDFILDALFSCNTVRPMPLFGVPGLVDHF